MLNILLGISNILSGVSPDNIPDGVGSGLDIDMESFIFGVIVGVVCILFIFGIIKVLKLGVEANNKKNEEVNEEKKS